jgi:hypothetical protein
MTKYQITFVPLHNVDNIQRETVTAESEPDARKMFTDTGCLVYNVEQVSGLDEVVSTYGADWEQDADTLRECLNGDAEWKITAALDMADYLDEKRTQEDARF